MKKKILYSQIGILFLVLILLLILFLIPGCSGAAGAGSPIGGTGGSPSPSPSPSPTPTSVEDSYRVDFIDVGQGDGALITTEKGGGIVVDAGNQNAGDTMVSFIEGKNISSLSALAISHPDIDHFGGMADVVDNFNAGEFIYNEFPDYTSPYQSLLSALGQKGIQKIKYKAGMTASFDNLTLTFFAPASPFLKTSSESNDNSLVFKLSNSSGVSVLFTGDVETEGITWMLSQGFDMKSTVLKVSHHGSPNGMTQNFYNAVKPAAAVISVGAGNPYGHPSSSVIHILEAGGSTVYRTDEQGTITFSVSGNSYQFSTEK